MKNSFLCVILITEIEETNKGNKQMNYYDIVNIVFWCISAVTALLLIHFIVFSIIGVFKFKKFPKTDTKLKYGLIIPARNEEQVVGNLIASIYKNNYPQDKLQVFVIAHNCTDRTAEIAREMGATVYEYNNPKENTMGFAFKYLFERIKEDYGTENYDGFFLFNADNILSVDYIDKMNDAFVACDKKSVITSFRNSKNFSSNCISGLYGIYFMTGCRLESRGRTVVGCSTRVQGTGYVISSDIVKDGWPYVTLTEDWEFSADQVLKGNKIIYCDEAVFYDEQPTTIKVMLRQRLRWAKGHLLVCLTKGKALLKKLFSKNKSNEKSNKFSVYDIFINCMPICVITTTLWLLQLILISFSPLFGIDAGMVWRQWAIGFGTTVAVSYLLLVLNAILIFIIERKRIKNVGFWKGALMTLMWPFFIMISIPIEFVALFSKNVGWKTIPHTDTTNFEQLNEEIEVIDEDNVKAL